MKLKKIFDYQKFENNPKLGTIIDDVEDKYYSSTARELSINEIDYVAAAGSKKIAEIEDKISSNHDEKRDD